MAPETKTFDMRKAPQPAPFIKQACFNAQSIKWHLEQMDLLRKHFANSPENLKEGWKSIFETAALVGSLVLAFIYETTEENLDICEGGTYYENGLDCSDSEDGLWGGFSTSALYVRNICMILSGLFAFATLVWSLQFLSLISRTPPAAFPLWLQYAPQRMYLVFYLMILTLTAFIMLIVLNITLTHSRNVALACVVLLGVALCVFLPLLFSTDYMLAFVLREFDNIEGTGVRLESKYAEHEEGEMQQMRSEVESREGAQSYIEGCSKLPSGSKASI